MNLRFLAIIAPIFIFCMPFINNDFLYIDDFNRANSGVYAWAADGRPFANLIYWAFNFGGKAIIAHPYSILISLLGFAFVIYKICEEQKLGIAYCVGLSFLIVNPYFSQPMLYKYDSFVMVASIAITALCFIKHDNRWLLFSVLFLTIGVGSYQTSLSLYISLSLLELIYTRKLGENYSLALIIKRALITILVLVIYKVILNFVDLSQYAKVHSVTIFNGSIGDFIQNLRSFIALLNSATSSFKVSSVILVLFIFSLLSISIFFVRNRGKEYCLYYSAMLVAGSIISLFMCFGGISLILLHPVFEPRVMTATYIGAFYLIATMSLVLHEKFALIIVGIFSLFAFYVSSAISFAYKEQSKFNEEIYSGILKITDANVIYSSHFIGKPKKSQFVELVESEIPMSNKINFFYFSNDLFSDTPLIYHGVKSFTKPNSYKAEALQCEKTNENAFIKACVSGSDLTVNFK